MKSGRPRISVVIPTFQRREECKRAVASALEQDAPPFEVLVCDDGSTDGTEDDLRPWAEEQPRLRYLRLDRNHGSPAPARNLGIESAHGEWIALLDSDDRWLPNKLAVQSDALLTDRYDVVACDAKRASNGPYFGLTAATEPDPSEFLIHNPIITSSAVARRSSLLSAGGFIRSAMGLAITGVEDYAIWLALAYRGARFLVLPDQLVTYDDVEQDRVSSAVARQEAEVAAVRWRLWLRRPHDVSVLGSALRGTFHAARWRLRPASASARPEPH
jgi:glycosyltransferase involved in cell wall biosynthesis